MKSAVISIVLSFITLIAFAQGGNVVQFSGIVLTADSLQTIPYAGVYVKESRKGTISNTTGFFSLAAEKGDTIIFSVVGMEKKIFVIPDTLKDSKYNIIQLMSTDTINLPTTVIYPWPTPEKLEKHFLALDLPDDDYERARKNLKREEMAELGFYTPNDGTDNFRYEMNQIAAKGYYAGQYPPMQILNPFAWAQFFKAWKRGDFKKKSYY